MMMIIAIFMLMIVITTSFTISINNRKFNSIRSSLEMKWPGIDYCYHSYT